MVSQCTAGLPDGKPRYVMGIGYPLDIVICSGGPSEVWQLAEAAAAAAAPCSVTAGNAATALHAPFIAHCASTRVRACRLHTHSAADRSSAGALATDPGARFDAATASGHAPPLAISTGGPKQWPPGLSVEGHAMLARTLLQAPVHPALCIPATCPLQRVLWWALRHTIEQCLVSVS